LFSKPL